jgi:membrane associated rhomboid family serine protease
VGNVFPFLLNLQNTFDSFIHNYLAFPSSFQRFVLHPWTIVTYTFFHAGIFHIAFNLFAFYFFGDIMQSFIGRKHIVPVFIIGSIAGATLYMLFYNVFPYFKNDINTSDLIGASAGVMAILLAATTVSPDLPIGFLIWRDLKLKYVAIIFILIDLASIASSNAGGHIAHLGGALLGWFYIKQLQNGNNLGAWWQIDFSKFKNRKKFQVHRNENFVEKKVDAKKTNEEKLNKILDKISASGYESLSNEEKDFLKKFGEQ